MLVNTKVELDPLIAGADLTWAR